MKAPNTYVYYDVRITSISARLDDTADTSNNWANCVMSCRAVRKDATGKELESFLTAVTSKYRKKHEKSSVAT